MTDIQDYDPMSEEEYETLKKEVETLEEGLAEFYPEVERLWQERFTNSPYPIHDMVLSPEMSRPYKYSIALNLQSKKNAPTNHPNPEFYDEITEGIFLRIEGRHEEADALDQETN